MAQSLTFRHWRGWPGRQQPAAAGLSSRRHIEQPVLIVMAVLLVMLTVTISAYLSAIAFSGAAPRAAAATVPDHRIGAIMYVPVKGPMCEVHRFDNITGQVVPDGTVDCERRTTDESAEPFGPSTERSARVRAITGAFRK